MAQYFEKIQNPTQVNLLERKEGVSGKYFAYFSMKTYVVDTH